jgi:hypothetical protein
MRNLFKQLKRGWKRLHLILSLVIGGGGFALISGEDITFNPVEFMFAFTLGTLSYWIIVFVVLWVMDGFRPTKETPELVLEKQPSEIQTKEINVKEDTPTNIIQRGLIFITLFFAFYFPIFWIFVWNTGTKLLTPLCVFGAIILSRHFGRKLIKAKFLHLYSSRKD